MPNSAAKRPGSGRCLPSAEAHATRFARQREADRTATAQDYVELIADLIREEKEARAVAIARRMGVSQATVTATVARLQRDGLVETQPYRGLFLTPAGQAMAETARARHELLVRFLIAVGLDAETAEQDAEGLEHHVSDKALAVFGKFLEGR
ncbi:manganese-binding transcriptional regulator MntR [Rhodovarius lipocyclicus]|jgi:DtxR family manganese transport transcriptional regulator|uniref:manganese-binding transcriptional regulator MntR n=1 Tax=Rhodovarius lipocyclicus TaxID=268410 RepID=UPI001358606C|nr:manganese-binding transcriptional regulator MntR [Rhodovarius lipocyclicus]